MPYIPIPIIDPYLVLPLGLALPTFSDDEDDEVVDMRSIEYDWFDVDVEDIVRVPVGLPILEPVEHVPITFTYRVRDFCVRWFEDDPGSHPFVIFVILAGSISIPMIPVLSYILAGMRREARDAWLNHRSPVYSLFNEFMGPYYGAQYWAEHRYQAAPRRADFPPPYKEPSTLWGKLVALVTPATIPGWRWFNF